MEKENWQKTSFTKDKIPNWICPYCKKSILKLDKLIYEENADSKSWHTDDDWDPEWIRYTFTGSLKCPICNEFVAFVGIGHEEFVNYYDRYTDELINENFS